MKAEDTADSFHSLEHLDQLPVIDPFEVIDSGIAQEGLECQDTALIESVKISHVFWHGSTPDPEIHNRMLLTRIYFSSQFDCVDGAGRRVEGHIDNRRDATGRSTLTSRFKAFPLFPTGFIEVDMGVDHTRQNQLSSGIDYLLCAISLSSRGDSRYLPPGDRQVGFETAGMGNQKAVLDDEIWFHMDPMLLIYLNCHS